MRISTFQIHQQGLNQLLDLNRQVAETQSQIASGRRVQKPSDDPVASARIIKIDQELALRERFISSAETAESLLLQEDAALDQVENVLLRIRELAVQAGSGVLQPDDRRFIATEIAARFDEVMGVANARTVDGEYLFGGFQGRTQPFVLNGDRIEFVGDEGQRSIQIESNNSVAVSDSGKTLFLDVDSRRTSVTTSAGAGNAEPGSATIGPGRVVDQAAADALFPEDLVIEFNALSDQAEGRPSFTVRRASDGRVVGGLDKVVYVADQPINVSGITFAVSGQPQPGDRFVVETTQKHGMLQTVKELADGLVAIDANEEPEAFAALLEHAMSDLDGAMTSVLEVRTQIGARLNTIDSTVDLHERTILGAREILSRIRDVDFAEAASTLSFQTFTLQAAQESFIRVSNLSLFNLL